MTKKTKLAAAFAALALLPAPALAQDYTIAVVQSLTGPAAFIGAPVVEGIRMSFEEAAASGQLGDLKLNLQVEDDAHDRAQVITLVNRFAADPNTLFFAGPTSGSVAGVAARVANDTKIPLMAVSNAIEVREAGPWSFITAQPGPVVVPRIGEFAAKERGSKVCQAVTLTDNEAYVTQARIFQDTVAANGVKLLEPIGVRGNESDFAALSVRVVDGGADCVYVGVPAAMAANVIIQLRQAGLDPETKIFGMSSFASPELIRIGGAAVEGVYFVADWVPGGNSPEARGFAERFQARTGREAGNWEAVGYATGQVIIAAVLAAGPNPTREAVRDALTATKDVPVVVGTGAFTYDQDRTPLYGVSVLTVKDGNFVAVE